ncbi:MAG: HD domain-containing protein [Oligoflexia bacterium]|nr:HD domain-containing protein [Oligoflexia bacterium]MBF0364846.1 HD domain-containing protein [Oligoflexia bacterium]
MTNGKNKHGKEIIFTAIPLSKIKPDVPLPTAVFLKINDKHIKFKEKDDCVTFDKFDTFIAKNVQYLYVDQEEAPEFIKWIAKIKKKKIDDTIAALGSQNRKSIEQVEEIKEKIYDTFLSEKLSPEMVGLLKENVSDFIANISKDVTAIDFLKLLRSENPSIADHSVNVANLSVYLAMVLGNGHQFVLENVYLGALFHDYAKAKIPVDILENTNSHIYSQAINDHPIKGASQIRKLFSAVPEQVFTIVEQHHEQFNGKGFPRGLAGLQIYELTKIVSVANIFDNQVSLNSKRTGDQSMYKLAIKFLEYDRGKHFDPKIMPKILNSLRLSF